MGDFYNIFGAMFGMGFGMMAAVAIVSIALSIFLFVCQWKVYQKLGLNGWECLIPFYNIYVLADACGARNLGIISIVCTVLPMALMFTKVGFLIVIASLMMLAAFIIQFVIYHYMLSMMGRPNWMLLLAIFAGIIFWPILAFTD